MKITEKYILDNGDAKRQSKQICNYAVHFYTPKNEKYYWYF